MFLSGRNHVEDGNPINDVHELDNGVFAHLLPPNFELIARAAEAVQFIKERLIAIAIFFNLSHAAI